MMLFLDISAFNDTSGAFILESAKDFSEKDRVESEWQCTAQKIQSQGQVQNFSFTAVLVIGIVSAIIILIGFILEPLIGCVRKRRNRADGGKRQLARDMDSSYWLLHAGLLGVGVTPWKYSGSEIPVTNEAITVQQPAEQDRECCQKFYVVDGSTRCMHETRSSRLPPDGADSRQQQDEARGES